MFVTLSTIFYFQVMVTNQLPHPIIDISSDEFDKDVSTLTKMSTSMSWRGNDQNNIMNMSNNLLLTCTERCNNIIQISENANDVQCVQFSTMNTTKINNHQSQYS